MSGWDLQNMVDFHGLGRAYPDGQLRVCKSIVVQNEISIRECASRYRLGHAHVIAAGGIKETGQELLVQTVGEMHAPVTCVPQKGDGPSLRKAGQKTLTGGVLGLKGNIETRGFASDAVDNGVGSIIGQILQPVSFSLDVSSGVHRILDAVR
jgi:hypothetical protein